MRRLSILAFGLVAAAAAVADTFVREDIITTPTPQTYSLCYDHQCATLVTLRLSAPQWSAVRGLFKPTPRSAEEERRRIARAVALLETMSGRMTGTGNDKEGDLKGLGEFGQMDCIDESINTTTYLRMLEGAGLLRFHTVEDRATRGWFIRGWPHTTAVIRDSTTQTLYAVDSWFEDNGRPPHIVPLEIWKEGWEPALSGKPDAPASPRPRPRRSR